VVVVGAVVVVVGGACVGQSKRLKKKL